MAGSRSVRCRPKCVPATSSDRTMHKTIWPIGCPVAIVRALSARNIAVIAQTTWRVAASISNPIAPEIAVICQSISMEMPRTVAAPLPPWNLRKGEKLCPTTAASAVKYRTVAGTPSCCPTMSAIAPLTASTASTKMPATMPTSRPILVAPGLRLPTPRMSMFRLHLPMR